MALIGAGAMLRPDVRFHSPFLPGVELSGERILALIAGTDLISTVVLGPDTADTAAAATAS